MSVGLFVVSGKPAKSAVDACSYHGALAELLSSPDTVQYLFPQQSSSINKARYAVTSHLTAPRSHTDLGPRLAALSSPLLLLCLVGIVKPDKWTMTDEEESGTLALANLLGTEGVLSSSVVREVVVMLCVRQDAWEREDRDNFLEILKERAGPSIKLRVFHARDGTLSANNFRELLSTRQLLTRFSELGAPEGAGPPVMGDGVIASMPTNALHTAPQTTLPAPPAQQSGAQPPRAQPPIADDADDSASFTSSQPLQRIGIVQQWSTHTPSVVPDPRLEGTSTPPPLPSQSISEAYREVAEALRSGHLVQLTVQKVNANKPTLQQPDQFYCDVCDKVVSGQPNWAEHLKGQAHKSKVTSSGQSYNCALCSKPIQGIAQAQEHVISAKHMKKVPR